MSEERRGLILEAVDTFIQIHDSWEADLKGPAQPTERFERALKLAVDVCERGDTPQDCRRLVAAVAKMGIEWIKYENGLHLNDPTGDVLPVRQFWEAVRDVKSERSGAVPLEPKKRESIALLRKQGLTDQMIAKAWEDPEWPNKRGPFYGSRGEANGDAIDAEIAANAKGETTLPEGYIHYDDRARLKRDEENLRTRLSQLRQEAEKKVSKEDPEAMLREGQFVNVVARECGLTQNEVVDIANKIGVKPQMTPNLASQRAPSEPQINEFVERAMDAGIRREEVSSEYEEPNVQSPADQIARMLASGMTKHAVCEQLGITMKDLRTIQKGVAQEEVAAE